MSVLSPVLARTYEVPAAISSSSALFRRIATLRRLPAQDALDPRIPVRNLGYRNGMLMHEASNCGS